MKRMLVNATQHEEVRVALVDGQELFDLAIEHREKEEKRGNIYKGRIARVEPSLEAAFVDFGAERHGFLPLEDISREYFLKTPESGKPLNIAELVEEGQQLVVQVEKDERDNKGAALSTHVSLAGRYLVLNANNPRGGGVSRQVRGEDRQAVQQRLGKLNIPKGMSVIIRTQGHDRSTEELQWDLDNQLRIWEAIKLAVLDRDGPFLVVQESSVILRAVRDYLSDSIGEVVVDDDEAYESIRSFMKHTMPHFLNRLRRHEGDGPLYNRYQIESQIDSAYRRRVNLPSGGQIIIDQPEAGICIDVNSARATSADDIEQTALQTNLEAADQIARQCRIRDLSGLIMIDFIDMRSSGANRQVEERLRQATRNEPARIQIGQISRFGILEMSRQRLRTSLVDATHETCPRCGGTGRIRGVESLGLHVLRMISEEAGKEGTSKVVAELPLVVANFLLNEKRARALADRGRVQGQRRAGGQLRHGDAGIRVAPCSGQGRRRGHAELRDGDGDGAAAFAADAQQSQTAREACCGTNAAGYRATRAQAQGREEAKPQEEAEGGILRPALRAGQEEEKGGRR